MPKYITSTNVSTLASVRGINPETEEISVLTKTLEGEPTDTEIKLAFFSPAFMPMKVISAESKTEKRRMDFMKWLEKSVAVTEDNRKDKGRFMVRTTKYTEASVKGINPYTEEISTKTRRLLGLYTEEEANEIKRLVSSDSFVSFRVSSLTVTEEKRRLSFDDWMRFSEPCGNETEDSE